MLKLCERKITRQDFLANAVGEDITVAMLLQAVAWERKMTVGMLLQAVGWERTMTVAMLLQAVGWERTMTVAMLLQAVGWDEDNDCCNVVAGRGVG